MAAYDLPEPNSFCVLQDFSNGMLVSLDKPQGWTSFDVVNKVRYTLSRSLGVKRIKVGHAGTLDPLATGLLVICTGRMTKQIMHLQAAEKRYTAVVHLGEYTATLDREGEVEKTRPTDHITEDAIREVAAGFVGVYMQVPPVFSAKKVDGKRAYKAARSGRDIDMPPVGVTIDKCDVVAIDGVKVTLDITCGKGTYIRSLARDFGERLGTVATLDYLRRTQSGDYHLTEALSLDDFLKKVRELPREAPE